MDALERFSSYLNKHKKVPYHQKEDLWALWYEEGQLAGEQITELTDWNYRFTQSYPENPSRSDIRCWMEEFFTNMLQGSMKKYCSTLYCDFDVLVETIMGLDSRNNLPELTEELERFFNRILFPSLTDGAYDKLQERQKEIMKKITGS